MYRIGPVPYLEHEKLPIFGFSRFPEERERVPLIVGYSGNTEVGEATVLATPLESL